MEKENEKLGKEAGELARAETLKHCKAVKFTPRRILQRLSEGLDAKENKVFYDKDRGKCIVGPDQIAHDVRLDAAKVGISIWGMKAPDKIEMNHQGNIMAAVVNHLSGNNKQPETPKVKAKKAKK